MSGANPAIGDLTIPSSLGGYPVTGIGTYAFRDCRQLTSVTIPASVTSMGWGAFYGCNGLTNATIPNSVTSIGEMAFNECSGLTAVTLPSSLTSIGKHVFAGCSGLTSVTIPNEVTSIGENAFYDCGKLTTVTIPPSVTSIGGYAFQGCSGLETLVLTNGVTSIGDLAFEGCNALSTLTLPSSVTSIGYYAFSGCNGLTTVTIPSSVTSLKGPFLSCSSLTEIVVETGNMYYMSKDGVLFTKAGNKLLQCPGGKSGSYIIPDCVAVIDDHAFQGCIYLSKVILPDSVTSIGDSAFVKCSSLSTVILSDSVVSIGHQAFEGCSGLTTMTIPDSVTSIGNWAFNGCTGLETLHVPTSWEGTGMLANARVPSGCRVVYDVPQSPLRLAAGERRFTADAASNQELGVAATVAWTAKSSATWLTLKTTSGSGDGTIVYDVAAYTTAAEARTGTITVTGGGITRTFTVTQGILWNYDIADGKATVRGAEQEEGDLAIPSSLGGCPVTRIGDCAWDWCPQLTSVTLPATLTDIDEWAFSDCSGLATVTIPAGVTNIGVGVFALCSGLTEIKVATGNKHYADKDGVLFTKSGDKLLQCPGGKTGAYTVPSGVKGIRGSAFEGCIALTSVTIPEGVTDIGASAFYYCNALKILYVPESWKTKYVEGKYWSEYALVPEGCKIVYCGPDGPEPITTTGVPYTWFSEYGLGDGTPAGFEIAADATAANGINTVAECYVAGLNPTNKASTFTTTLVFTNGHPVVTWSPNLNENDTRTNRFYLVEGRPTMTNAWDKTNSASRFFRVKVSLPQPSRTLRD